MIEDKAKICRALCETLKLTRVGENLTTIQYIKEDDRETALLVFNQKHYIEVDVTADSGRAMIEDILRKLK